MSVTLQGIVTIMRVSAKGMPWLVTIRAFEAAYARGMAVREFDGEAAALTSGAVPVFREGVATVCFKLPMASFLGYDI